MNLKQKIRNKEVTLGSWVTIPNQAVIEIWQLLDLIG